MTTELERLLSESNPVKTPRADWNRETAARVLSNVVSRNSSADASRAQRTSRLRVTRIAVGMAAVLVAGALFIGVGPRLLPGSDTAAFAATPNPLSTAHAPTQVDVQESLAQIERRALASVDDSGSGDVASVSIRSWDLFTRIDGQQVNSKVVPALTTTRTDPNGDTQIDRRYLEAGQDEEKFSDRTELSYPLRGLSSEDAELSRQLSIGQPTTNGSAGQFDSIVQAYRQMPIEPDVRAAILRHVARLDGIRTVGRVTDRSGRDGIGYTVDSLYSGLPTRYMLIFDPASGKLLAYEEMLTTDAGKLNVDVPSVVQYQTFLKASYVER